jgi:2-polyprenyl-3-methyl-5-hydroxy-6-metoxy-1,4-benzoquinol methylase
MTDGWQDSAAAWARMQQGEGDYARSAVLDAPMLALATLHGARRVLDLGCGEGRFCRMLAASGLQPTGIDPTPSLLERIAFDQVHLIKGDTQHDQRLACLGSRSI